MGKKMINLYSMQLLFTITKLSFGILFFGFQLVLGTPLVYDLMRTLSILSYTCGLFNVRVAMGACCVCVYVLMVLQFVWVFLILKGL